jgi:hypothetical protein
LNEFEVTMTAKTEDGKTVPVEWEVRAGPNRGAQVNIDDPTAIASARPVAGPQVPHVGYRTGGKPATKGHIIVDDVLAARPPLNPAKPAYPRPPEPHPYFPRPRF